MPTTEGMDVTLELSKVFTYFMVLLGPFKLLGPFARLTRGLDAAASRRVAIQAFAMACVGGLVATYLGQKVLYKWGVSLPALLLAAGLVLLLVALRTVLGQYETPETAAGPEKEPPAPRGIARALTFPHIITPSGTAALILLLAASTDRGYDLSILAVFLAVMVLDLVAMIFAKTILRYAATLLSIIGAVLGVLQVALAVQLLLNAGRLSGVLPGQQ